MYRHLIHDLAVGWADSASHGLLFSVAEPSKKQIFVSVSDPKAHLFHNLQRISRHPSFDPARDFKPLRKAIADRFEYEGKLYEKELYRIRRAKNVEEIFEILWNHSLIADVYDQYFHHGRAPEILSKEKAGYADLKAHLEKEVQELVQVMQVLHGYDQNSYVYWFNEHQEATRKLKALESLGEAGFKRKSMEDPRLLKEMATLRYHRERAKE